MWTTKHLLQASCTELTLKSAKNDAIRKLNECQSKHYIFSTVVVVMFTDSATSFIRNFMRLSLYFGLTKNSGNLFLYKLCRKVSKLFKNESIHLEKFWPHYDIDNTILWRKIGSNTLTIEGPWKVTLNDKSVYPKHCKNIPSIKCRSCETNSVVKYKIPWIKNVL